MNLIPGWDSVTGAHWWSNFYFWGSIVALILLGIAEIVSHRYGERTDELAAINQDATKRAHETEIAALHRDEARLSADAETAKAQIAIAQAGAAEAQADIARANEQAAALENQTLVLRQQAADAQTEAARATALAARVQQAANWRIMPEDQRRRLGAALAEGVGGVITLAYEAGDPECLFLAMQMIAAFDVADQTVGKRLWQVNPNPRVHSRAIYWGIKVFGQTAGMVNSLQEAFRAAELPYGIDSIPNVMNDSPGIVIGGGPRPPAEIWIGPRRPPNFSP